MLGILNRNGERYLMLVFYSLIVFVIVAEVVRRFGLHFSSIWGEEVARYSFIFLGWVGASYAVKERAHIRFDSLIKAVPPRWSGLVYLIGDLATLLMAAIAIYWSVQSVASAIRFESLTPGLRVGTYWFLASVPLAFLMMVVRLFQSMARDLADLRAGRPAYAGKTMFEL
jgi:TRAP-type C4-dicarboxylate transport system permease small subunit